MLHPSFPIETERLFLRPFEEGDYDWFVALRRNKALMAYLPFGEEAEEEMKETFARRQTLTQIEGPGDGILCVMAERDSGARMGEMMLRAAESPEGTGEIGFILHGDIHGKGYAREASLAFMRLGFEDAGFHRLIAVTGGRNTASQGLIERLGFRKEAHFREAAFIKGAWRDELHYAMLASEWNAAT